jgi:hypothetical protein
VSESDEPAENPSDAAVTVVDRALAQVLRPGTPSGTDVPIHDLGLRPEDLQRLSELLLQELGAFVMPAAITWCETVEDLCFLVDQVLQRRGR